MGRRRRGKGRGRRPPVIDVDAVLAGDISLDAAELVALIHRVNPTDKGLSPADTKLRYAQKSALQSLLIRRFSDFLEVEPELDDDARSWIRQQLAERDLRGESNEGDTVSPSFAPEAPARRPAASPAPATSTRPAAILLDQGRAALDAYDYEEAERLFRHAWETSRSADAAVALLELLVDHLAADVDALQLREEMPPRVAALPAVAGLLAVAAARCAPQDVALRYLQAAPAARAVEALGILVKSALKTGDLEAAGGLLRRVDQHAGGDADLQQQAARLAAAVDAAEQKALVAAEAELQQQVSGLPPDDAEAHLKAFLERHPASAAATRLLRQVARARVAPEVAQMRADAAAQLDAGDARAAVRLLREAAELDPHDRETDQLLEQAEAALQRQLALDAEDQVARLLVTGQLDAAALREGLVGWRALPDGSRDRLVDRLRLQLLRDFDALLKAHRREPLDDLIGAAHAFDAARRAMQLDQAGEVVTLLEGHRRLLRELPEAVELYRQATRRVAEQQQEAAQEALRAAEEALDEGDVGEARRLLAQITDGQEVDEERLRQAEERLAVLERRQRQRQAAQDRWEQATGRSRGAGGGISSRSSHLEDLLAAIQAIEAAVDLPNDPWAKRLTELRSRLPVEAELLVVHDPDPEVISTTDVVVQAGEQDSETLLTLPDGHLLHVQVTDGYLFARAMEPGTCRVRVAASLSLPNAVRAPCHISLLPEGLCIQGGDAVVVVDTVTWLPTRWLRIDAAAKALTFDQVIFVGDHHLWGRVKPSRGSAGPVRVIDLRTGALVRELPDAWCITAIQGMSQPLGLRFEQTRGATLHEADGTPVTSWSSPALRWTVMGVAHPAGDDRLVLFANPGPGCTDEEVRYLGLQLGGEDDAVDKVVVVTVAPDGSGPPPRPLAGTPTARTFGGALDPTDGVVVALQERMDGTGEIRAIELGDDGGLESLWSLDFEGGSRVAGGGAEPVHVVFGTADGLRSIRAGRSRPALDFTPAPTAVELPSLELPFDIPCAPKPGNPNRKFVAGLRRMTPGDVEADLEQAWTHEGRSPQDIVSRAYYYREAGLLEAADELVRRVLERYPGWASARAFLAATAAHGGDFEEVLLQFGTLETCRVEGVYIPHYCHLRGVALYWHDRLQEAYETFQAGLDTDGGRDCPLGLLADLAEPMAIGVIAVGRLSPIRQLRLAVKTASDAMRLDRCGPTGIDVPVVWRARERHSLAWLADALIKAADAAGSVSLEARLRMRLALALFVDAWDVEEGAHRSVAWSGANWGAVEQGELRDRVEEWLLEQSALDA